MANSGGAVHGTHERLERKLVTTMVRTIIIFCLLFPCVADATIRHIQDSTTVGTASDGNNGSAWGSAYASVAYAQTQMSTTDTLLFGAGSWWGVQITPLDSTVYADSTFVKWGDTADVDTSWNFLRDQDWFAHIYGGSLIPDEEWAYYDTTDDGDSIFSANWTTVDSAMDNLDDGDMDQIYTLGPVGNDTLCAMQTSLGAIDKPWEAWHKEGATPADDSIFIIMPDGGTPVGDSVVASARRLIYSNNGAEHWRMMGLHLAYSKQGVCVIHGTGGADSVFFVHCRVEKAGYLASNNGGDFLIRSTGALNEYFHIVSCDLGTSTYDGFDASSGGRYFAGIETYQAPRIKVDSCRIGVNGPLRQGAFFKDGDQCPNGGRRVSNCLIVIDSVLEFQTSAGVHIYNNPGYDSVYNNIIIGGEIGISYRHGGVTDAACYYYEAFVAHNVCYGQFGAHITIYTVEAWPEDSCGRMEDVSIITGNVGSSHRWGELEDPPNRHAGYYIDNPPNICHSIWQWTENHWYDGTNTRAFFDTANSSNTFLQWQAYGYDVAGDTVDPQFDSVDCDPANAFLGFARTDASNDIASPLTINGTTFNKAGINPASGGESPSATKMKGWKP